MNEWKNLLISVLFLKFSCCGVDNYEDFKNAAHWSTNPLSKSGMTLMAPLACCKKLPTGQNLDDFQCAVQPKANVSNYEVVSRVLVFYLEKMYNIFQSIIGADN